MQDQSFLFRAPTHCWSFPVSALTGVGLVPWWLTRTAPSLLLVSPDVVLFLPPFFTLHLKKKKVVQLNPSTVCFYQSVLPFSPGLFLFRQISDILSFNYSAVVPRSLCIGIFLIFIFSWFSFHTQLIWLFTRSCDYPHSPPSNHGISWFPTRPW